MPPTMRAEFPFSAFKTGRNFSLLGRFLTPRQLLGRFGPENNDFLGKNKHSGCIAIAQRSWSSQHHHVFLTCLVFPPQKSFFRLNFYLSKLVNVRKCALRIFHPFSRPERVPPKTPNQKKMPSNQMDTTGYLSMFTKMVAPDHWTKEQALEKKTSCAPPKHGG